MVNKCCVYGCDSNYESSNVKNVAVFAFPSVEKKPKLGKIWITFVNRKDWNPSKWSKICEFHFEMSCFNEGKQRKRLNWSVDPVYLLCTLQANLLQNRR